MTYRLSEISGVLHSHVTNLAAIGIKDTDDLLSACGTPAGRDHVYSATKIPVESLMTWTQRAELMRIAGVGNEYAALLIASGVDTLVELGRRVATDLHDKLEGENETLFIVKNLPSTTTIQDWVVSAKGMKPSFTLH